MMYLLFFVSFLIIFEIYLMFFDVWLLLIFLLFSVEVTYILYGRWLFFWQPWIIAHTLRSKLNTVLKRKQIFVEEINMISPRNEDGIFVSYIQVKQLNKPYEMGRYWSNRTNGTIYYDLKTKDYTIELNGEKTIKGHL